MSTEEAKTVVANVRSMLTKRDLTPVDEYSLEQWADTDRFDGIVLVNENKRFACFIADYIAPDKKNEWSKIGKSDILNVASSPIERSIEHFIIVTRQKLTPKGKSEVLALKCLKIELFEWDYFSYNLLAHKLQPRSADILSQREVQRIFSAENIQKLPEIKADDKLARYFGAMVGNIFRFERRNGEIYYRRVTL
jgi:DNA-directed RNA polymerase subunit H (RpoH/RPB5)